MNCHRERASERAPASAGERYASACVVGERSHRYISAIRSENFSAIELRLTFCVAVSSASSWSSSLVSSRELDLLDLGELVVDLLDPVADQLDDLGALGQVAYVV